MTITILKRVYSGKGGAMEALVKAVEVWAPGPESMTLECIKGSYVHLDVKPKSRVERTALKFAMGQGILGRCWATRSPEIAISGKDLSDLSEGLNQSKSVVAAAVLPIFSGEYLLTMTVLYFTHEADQIGSVEHWQCQMEEGSDLKLKAGLFNNLEHFEFISKHTSFRKGVGLPGLVWEKQHPVIIHNLAQSRIFLRSQGAAQAGVNNGFAIPCVSKQGEINVFAFLSSTQSPLAHQVEVWSGDTRDSFTFQLGYSRLGLPLKEFYSGKTLELGEGMLGRALLTGRPELSETTDDFYFSDIASERDCELKCKLVMPLLSEGRCSALIVLYF